MLTILFVLGIYKGAIVMKPMYAFKTLDECMFIAEQATEQGSPHKFVCVEYRDA